MTAPEKNVVDEAAQAVLDQHDEDEPDDTVEPPADPTPLGQTRGMGGANSAGQPRVRQGFRVNAPARPDLQPGESITTVPERWCERCQEPRGGRKCNVCNAMCVVRVDIEDAEPYEPPMLVSERDPADNFFARRRDQAEEFVEEYYEEEQPQRRFAGGGRTVAAAPVPRNQRTPPARGRNQMPMQQRSRLVRNGEGQVVHMSGRSNAQRRMGTAEEQLAGIWLSGSIDKSRWYEGLCAAVKAHAPQTPEDVEACAELADSMYIQMMLRENAG